jgi:hypothetical protein
MRASRLTVENGLYILALLLAFGLRVLNLGSTPLSDYEASWALQALELARGGEAMIGANPLYVVVTGAFFYLLNDSNATARLLPALSGSALVLVPLIFKESLLTTPRQRMAGVILAFGLALDPGLVTVSRLAGGPMPSLALGLLALGAAFARKPVLTGLLAGLALLSGSGLLVGAVGLILTWGLVRWMPQREEVESLETIPEGTDTVSEPSAFQRSAVRIAIAVVLVGGTLFLIAPQGLAGFAATFSEYLSGWVNRSGVPALRLPASLLIYQPLVVIFGMIGLLRGWLRASMEGGESALARRLSIWAFLAFVLAMIYPGRQMYDLIWVLVPLWALACLEFARYIPLQETRFTLLIALGQALLVLTLLLLAGMNFMGLARFRTTEAYYLIIIFGSLVMILVATLLVGSGWSFRAAQMGVVWGASAALGLSLLSSTWGLSQLRQNSPEELYSVPPAAGQVDLLLATISDLSQWGSGLRQQIDLSVTYDVPSLRWALRGFANASFVPELAIADVPSVIVTPQSENSPTLTQSYRGQDFNWRIYPAWEGVLPPDIIAWLAYRQAPLLREQVVLWGRADLFPGGELEQSEGDAVP